MSQFVNSCYNYDEMLNDLINTKMIKTINEEKALRSVDYGYYFDTEGSHREPDWQFEARRHMVYTTAALNALMLNSGQKFLNIGSGVGYFSTVAGILLGNNSVNHGIEINERFVDLAREKLAEFNLNSAAIDHHDFCEPIFIQGNACELLSTGYYDRVYCEAVVPYEKLIFMKSLIKINGILVMPFDGFLWKVIRKDEIRYKAEIKSQLIENAFSNLILPDFRSLKIVTFPPVKQLNLQELCRNNIRSSMRQYLLKETDHLKMHTMCHNLINTDPDKERFLWNIVKFISSFKPRVIELDHLSLLHKIKKINNDSNTGLLSICPGISDGLLKTTDKSGNSSKAESENDSEAISHLTMYHFIKDYRVNKLSRCLKEEIYSLSIPTQVKHFLNYDRID
ncbi:S-adenosyl-L-methionine-dependent methyltransferase [Cinara cedri]|uniref:S-adenosyl-L-methionine-dependent methyltransferase n=1 Tax=Cinara cedri TaxID=506608 RepID=A0A5E4MWS2_9HEMI|nr:S-adenosyl-L-methionine-dependent methyltransferase [Cinara cedri]